MPLQSKRNKTNQEVELIKIAIMTLNEFLKYVETRKPLKGDEIHQFMNKMSDEARRMTFELNGSYHAPEEIRELLSRLFNKPVDPSFRVSIRISERISR